MSSSKFQNAQPSEPNFFFEVHRNSQPTAEHQNTIEESERRGRGGATAEGARRRAVKAEERSERRRRGEERYAPGASSPTCGGERAGAGRRRRGLASWRPEMEVGAAERRRRSLSRWRRNSQATVADLPRRRRCAAARLDSTSRTLAF